MIFVVLLESLYVFFVYFVFWHRVYILVICVKWYYHVCFLAKVGGSRPFKAYYGGKYLVWIINRVDTI